MSIRKKLIILAGLCLPLLSTVSFASANINDAYHLYLNSLDSGDVAVFPEITSVSEIRSCAPLNNDSPCASGPGIYSQPLPTQNQGWQLLYNSLGSSYITIRGYDNEEATMTFTVNSYADGTKTQVGYYTFTLKFDGNGHPTSGSSVAYHPVDTSFSNGAAALTSVNNITLTPPKKS